MSREGGRKKNQWPLISSPDTTLGQLLAWGGGVSSLDTDARAGVFKLPASGQ